MHKQCGIPNILSMSNSNCDGKNACWWLINKSYVLPEKKHTLLIKRRTYTQLSTSHLSAPSYLSCMTNTIIYYVES